MANFLTKFTKNKEKIVVCSACNKQFTLDKKYIQLYQNLYCSYYCYKYYNNYIL